MDYTPLQNADAFSFAVGATFIVAVASLITSVLISVGSEKTDKVKVASNVLFAVGVLLALATVALAVYSSVSGSTPAAREDAYLRDAAAGLSETYGIEVTEQNIKEMDYPTDEQNERRYFGTTAVKTGPNVNDFITARLAYDNGKVYLLKQVGEDYEELEPVR